MTDWSSVRERLRIAEESLERRWKPTADEMRAILRARAEKLSRPPEGAREVEEQVEVVEFRIGTERYAVESAYVREVYPLRGYSAVPGAPDFIFGIINLRGQIISVVDLAALFGLPAKVSAEKSVAIVLRSEETEFGILSETAVGVRSIPVTAIKSPPPDLSGARADFLHGITVEKVAVLDARRLLSDKRLVVEEEAA